MVFSSKYKQCVNVSVSLFLLSVFFLVTNKKLVGSAYSCLCDASSLSSLPGCWEYFVRLVLKCNGWKINFILLLVPKCNKVDNVQRI